jgi:hypothetical protein
VTDPIKLRALRDFLSHFRFNYSSEAELQEGIERALSATTYAVQRELRLDDLGRLDFFIDGEIVIETKIEGSAPQLMRQVSRYAQSPKVLGILVVTDRATHTLPPSFNGKPVLVHSLLDGAL